MRFSFADDQEELRRTTRRVLDGHDCVGFARALGATGPGHDAALWKKLGGDLGLAGLVVPEACGGAGLGWVELVGVMEELGRSLASVPLLSTVLATSAILAGAQDDDDDEQQHALLAPIAQGGTAALGYLDARPTSARRDGTDAILSGAKRHVIDGHSADLLIVSAREADGSIALYAIAPDAAGVSRARLPTMDASRALADIELDDVRVPLTSRLGRAGALDHALALGSIALAAEQVGGAQRCLDLSVEYAKVRTQFGRPIGSFQAIQHKCADQFVLVESARSAAYYAGWAAAQPPGTLEAGDDVATLAAIAKAYCSDAFYACAAETIQIHGGIGFTWEHDAHLYFKRARASRDLLGSPAQHRERLAAGAIGLGTAGGI
jgi:alkylation response protein AidB-like acyl-CoA dehydrogenase